MKQNPKVKGRTDITDLKFVMPHASGLFGEEWLISRLQRGRGRRLAAQALSEVCDIHGAHLSHAGLWSWLG